MSLTRRQFLKAGIAGAVASQGLGWFAADSVFAADTVTIPSASHFGPFKAVVKNGTLIGIQPWPEYDARPNHMLTEGLLSRVYHPTRVRQPMVRKSWLANPRGDSKPHLRGKEAFVPVSWDDVLALTADSILSTAEADGNQAILSASYSGWAHAGLLRPHILQNRLFSLIGGHSITSGNYSFGASMASLSHIMGGMEVFMPQTSWEVIHEHTELMVLIGCDPWSNNRIDFNVADHQMQPNWLKFKQKGIRFISINPQRTRGDEVLGADWVPIRPNTDTAMFLAMAWHLHTTGRTDAKYIARYTVGHDKFLTHLLGKDGTPAKTPQWAATITGMPAEKIIELADLFAAKRTQFAVGWSLQRAQHGEMPHWAVVNLAAMLGKIGKPGEGVGFSWHYSGSGMPQSTKTMPVGLSQGRNPVTTRCPASRISAMLQNPGKTYRQNGGEHKYPDVRLIYTAGNNFMSHQQDTNELIRAMNKKVHTVISQDPWWCASSRFADIVLPATTTLERNDLSHGGSYSSDKIYAMRQVIAPYGDSLDDFEIFRRLGELMGVGVKFTGVYMAAGELSASRPMEVMDILRDAYARSDARMPFDEFWQQGVTRLEVPDVMRQWVLHGDFIKDPDKNPLPTASGRIELYSSVIDSYKLPDCPPLPKFIEPAEYLGNAREGELHVVSPHPYDRLHSQMANADLRQRHSIQGRQYIRINSQDARARGIQDGDLVELYNDRGALIGGAQVSDDIMPGVVSVEEGQWLQLDSKGRCNSGAINMITSSRPASQLSQATSANTCLAQLKKCSDAESPNRAFEPPATTAVVKNATAGKISSRDFAVRASRRQSQQLGHMSAGEKLYYERCTQCHAPQEPADYTWKQWQGITELMFKRANLNGDERKAVLEFLSRHAKDAASLR